MKTNWFSYDAHKGDSMLAEILNFSRYNEDPFGEITFAFLIKLFLTRNH